jgi:hypothetical protein
VIFYRWRRIGEHPTARFADASGVTAGSNVNLIVAALGLQEVRSVLSAIRTADLESAKFSANRIPAESCDRYCPGAIRPEPRYLPRQLIHPTPRYLPRPVIHPTPRFEPAGPPAGSSKTTPPNLTPAPPPPWKTLPWHEPVVPPNVIKVIIRPPDIAGKGMLIDLFL